MSHADATCPACRAPAGGFNYVSGAHAEPGDYAICAYCGAVNVYRDDRRLRRASNAEAEQVRATAAKLRASPLGTHEQNLPLFED